MNNNEPDFLTVTEVATYLRSGASTVRVWIREGRLPIFRIGRRVLIHRADIERLTGSRPPAAVGGGR
jgi:excisionase family DNA binding protein